VGRAISDTVTELGLATIPGFFGVGSGPSGARPYGVFRPARIPAILVPQEVTILGSSRTVVESVISGVGVELHVRKDRPCKAPNGPTTRAPLGVVVGARSGDKGGNANLGVFTREDAAWGWLSAFLTVDRLRFLLPETAPLEIDRYEFPSLRALNFVVHGLLQEGVAASTRQDGQAKSLGEWLRSRVVDMPRALIRAEST
jgi:hypothetical protein